MKKFRLLDSFLRTGTACVVINEKGEVLLSQRGDLKTWNLPGGRLDAGETLEHAAAREVREETGIEIDIERPVGLYYTTRWQRLNVVFKARSIGGTLLGRTHETLDNRWFSPDALPEPMLELHRVRIADALSGEIVLRVYETPLDEYRRLRRKFAWRWVKNLLSGRPESRYPRFTVFAKIVLVDTSQQQVVMFEDEDTGIEIPYALCIGDVAPWQEITEALEAEFALSVPLRWIGVLEILSKKRYKPTDFHTWSELWFYFVASVSHDDIRLPKPVTQWMTKIEARWSRIGELEFEIDKFVSKNLTSAVTYPIDDIWLKTLNWEQWKVTET